MAKGALWWFLFAVTALQSTWSAPASTKLQLKFDVANEMLQLMTTTLDEFKDFVQRVIDEAELILPPDSNSVILDMCQRLVGVLNPMDIDDTVEMDRVAEAVEDILTLFDSLSSAEFNSEAEEIVLSIFEQLGGEEIERRLEDKLADVLQRIEQKLANYIASWSDSRRARNSEFLKWFLDFKNEQDTFEKLDLLYHSDLI